MSERRGLRLGARTRMLRDVEEWETSIPVHSTAAFSDAGEIFSHGERITYKRKTANSFEECERGASRGVGGSEPRFIPGGSDVTQSNPGDYVVASEGTPVSARPNLDLIAGPGISVVVEDDAEADSTRITLAVDLGQGITLAPVTATTGAAIKLSEGTNNGANTITLAAPASLAADYTQTLPGASGTVALIPTMTHRTSANSISNGTTSSPTVACLAGEVVTGGGCDADSGVANLFLIRARVDGNGYTCTYSNTSGSTRTVTAKAVCMAFPT